jgi:hypothetical protein
MCLGTRWKCVEFVLCALSWAALPVAAQTEAANAQGEDEGQVRSLGEPTSMPDESIWSAGAGISFGTYYLGGIYALGEQVNVGSLDGLALGGIGPGGVGLGASAFMERRLSDSLWFLFSARAGYGAANYQDSRDSSSTTLGLELGLRWCLNPGGRIEISPWGTLGGDWQWVETEGTALSLLDTRWKSYSYGIGLQIGLALDLRLLDNLYLRLTSSLVGLRYAWSEQREWIHAERRSTRSASRTTAHPPSGSV